MTAEPQSESQPQPRPESAPGQRSIRLRITVGNAAIEPGRTEIDLASDGAARITNELDGNRPREIVATVDPGAARELIEEASESLARGGEGKRYGVPDEPRYHIEVVRDGQRRAADVWRSELADRPALGRVIARVQRIVDEQSKGEILL